MDDNGSKIRIDISTGSGWAAIVLICMGVVMFVDNLGLVPFAHLGAYWPVAISAYGAVLLSRARTSSGKVWPVTMIAIGILLTLGNLGILHVNMGSLWPLFLVAAGASMLLKPPRERFRQRSMYFTAGSESNTRFNGNILYENAVFSGVKRRVDSATFEGADLNCSFGEIKIDLRGATISTPNRQAIIETNASFVAIKLRIPETWKVEIESAAIFGACEDKSVPPRPVPGVDPPTLIIRGNAAFGAVEIEN